MKVNDRETKRIAKKVAIFYVFMIGFFLLGVDFPPPIGFLSKIGQRTPTSKTAVVGGGRIQY